jgi:tRNA (mo5U34)-methyltransferase
MDSLRELDRENIRAHVERLTWYHTIDLGSGLVTPGIFDHRPYLPFFGIPKDLSGRTVLDIGAASGFFSFEMERRGGLVTATDLPSMTDHDFGPVYRATVDVPGDDSYIRQPFLLAREILGSKVVRREISVYEMTPESLGTFDFVLCGSLLLHLTDPVRALWKIRNVTRGLAIIATVINPRASGEPAALFYGNRRGDVWWIPNRAGLEAMVQSAGFAGWEWFSEFRLDYRDGRMGHPHGVIRAWNTSDRPADLSPPPRIRPSAGVGPGFRSAFSEITRGLRRILSGRRLR